MLNTKVFTIITPVIIFWAATDVVQCKYIYHEEVSRWVQQDKVVATWEQAKIHCEREGAVLASPINEELLQYMTSLIEVNNHESSYFIGMKLIQNTEVFRSIEGAMLDDLPESVINRIDKLDPREGDCLGINRSNIHVVPCWARLPYLCYANTTSTSTVFEPMTTPSSRTETPTTIWANPPTVAPTSNTTHGGTDCEFGYQFHFAGSCYKVHDAYESWNEARETCLIEGGYLAVINDATEAQYLKTIFSRPYDEDPRKWIGLRKIDGDWRSINGDRSEQIFNVWSWSVSGLECGALKDDGLLDDQSCTVQYRFICEKSVQDASTQYTSTYSPLYESSSSYSPPTTMEPVTSETSSSTYCGSGYQFHLAGSCYKVHDEYKSWNEAEYTCSSEGGYLAVINDANEARYLETITSRPDDNYVRKWIGLRKIDGDRSEQIFNVWSSSVSGLECGALKDGGLLDDQHCTFKYRFICEKSKQDASTQYTSTYSPLYEPSSRYSPPTTVESSTYCGSGYHFHLAGSCYKVHDEYKSWDEARYTCSSEGGYLAIINDANEARYLETITSRPDDDNVRKWIGLRKIDGNWRSIKGDRSEQIFNVWSSSVSGLECGALKDDGLLDDQHCTFKSRFICEKSVQEASTQYTSTYSPPYESSSSYSPPMTMEPVTSETASSTYCGSAYQFHLAGSCYKVHDEYKSWNEARYTCSSEGGYLAVINDATEAQYLKTISSRPNDEYLRKWIGLRKIDGDWRSINGDRSEQIFNVWSWSVSGLECGALKDDGLLDDQSCTVNYRFICEKSVQEASTQYTSTYSPPYESSSRYSPPTTMKSVTSETAPSTYCGSDYQFHFAGSCYKVHRENKSWDEAQSICSSEGGYLAVINDANEADYLATITSRSNDLIIPKWIGLRKINGDWRSVKGDSLEQIFNVWSSSVSGLECGALMYNGLLDDQSCTFKYRFICERSVHDASTQYTSTYSPSYESSSSYSPPTTMEPVTSETASSTYCGSGYEFDFAGSCYKVHDEYKSWDEAQSTCSSEGGYLAVINDANEARYLQTITYRPYDMYLGKWIGLRKINGDWRSVKGDRLEQIYNDWTSSVYGLECGALRTYGLLEDQHCGFRYRFICEKSVQEASTQYTSTYSPPYESSSSYSPPTTMKSVTSETESPTHCGSGYQFYMDSCYKVYDVYKTWSQAESVCINEGGHLVVIEDADEAEHLKSITSRPNDQYSRKWIGITNENGAWMTISGQYVHDLYNVWADSAFGLPCGTLQDDGLLDDDFCGYKYRFICEKYPIWQ